MYNVFNLSIIVIALSFLFNKQNFLFNKQIDKKINIYISDD